VQSFSELPLSPELLRAIEGIGFETPSPIQQQALPILLGERTDFMGLAGTGTGKTAAFSIPLLERINSKVKAVQALILCPTRELAMQVAGQIDLLGKYKGVRTVTVYGGASYSDQIRGLQQSNVVVGTPGRVIDHIQRGTLKLDQVQILVLDEADEMFSMGFKEELDAVLAGIPREESNIWLFSATMSREVRRIAETNLREPKTVQVNRTEMLSSGVEQYFYRASESEKPEMICKLIEAADGFYGLIFCQTKALVADLTTYMIERGYKVDCLHGDKDQSSREHTMQSFRDRKLQVLICTDVAARGLDVKDITHVVNYSLPREMESYVHRIGRTARSGKTGIVMNLVTMSHRHLISRIEGHTKVRMKEGFVPTRREIGTKKVGNLLAKFQEQPFHTRVLEVMGEEWKEKVATMTPEVIAAHFITMMMPDIFGGEEPRAAQRTDQRSEQRREPRNEQRYEPRNEPRRERRDSAPRYESAGKPAGRPTARPSAVPAVVVDRPTVVASEERSGPRFGDERPQRRQPYARPRSTPAVVDMDSDEVSILDRPTIFGVSSNKPAARPRRDYDSPRPSSLNGPAKSFVKPFAKSGAPTGKTNFTKLPKHPAGPALLNRHADETPVMNRRARRAALFGRTLEDSGGAEQPASR
jgi:ATP-dependent RNA helicase DeaD